MYVIKRERLFKRKDSTFTLFMDDAIFIEHWVDAITFCKTDRGEYIIDVSKTKKQ